MRESERQLNSKDPLISKLIARYQAACHAMQSGVAIEMTDPSRSQATDPKHLRVGVNSAMVETSALVELLIDKGVFTAVEWFEGLCRSMEREVTQYEARLEKKLGKQIKLA
jgi:hypothetical protein